MRLVTFELYPSLKRIDEMLLKLGRKVREQNLSKASLEVLNCRKTEIIFENLIKGA